MKYQLLTLLIIIACVNTHENPEYDVYFCPHDNCTDVIVNLIRSSENVKCALYDLDDMQIINALYEKNAEIVLDHRAVSEHTRELDVVVGPKGHQMHNKFCVFNDSIVFTGSLNPTFRGLHKNNNNLLLIRSKDVASMYLVEFREMQKGTFGSGRKSSQYLDVQVRFCPEDCDESQIVNLIDAAKNSVQFMTFSFTSDAIGEALIRAHNRGVNISGVMEKTQNNKYVEYPKLTEAGVDVIWDSNPYNMHHKVFIIDKSIVVTGSANPSNNGFRHNDENLLIIRDADLAQKYVQEFSTVYHNFNK